ncbi:kinase [Gordoniibacillus kamchatkensis]|uniref:Kinase n=1 Tax=Gordoniibacillus kamchatkensis TaxID=1590651 RepID=A0ABR5AH06_9BACL|nr:sporulation phosphorelay system protein KapB [Paenibacillus sp. VKM B-2647]KIL40177.1 kinase [Paenibacillus sp. VKM B-2647]
MEHEPFKAGDIVVAEYKSGRYIGRIVELTSSRKAAVEIMAVARHPQQGDLHHPMQADVGLFHQRRALAHKEIALMLLTTIEPYRGSVPDYADSLRHAVQSHKQELNQLQRWAERALAEMEALEKDYFRS